MNIESMSIEEVIERINFLYKKSQNEGLDDGEKNEQKLLRQRYVNNVKKNFKAQLDGIKKVDKKQ